MSSPPLISAISPLPWLVLCGGFHPRSLTERLGQELAQSSQLQPLPQVILPITANWPDSLSGFALRQQLQSSLGRAAEPPIPLIVVAFSAGCLGSLALAHHYWQRSPGAVRALFAVDGWGVPLVAPFPVYRLSHDWFTHVTCRPLGSGVVNFWADPAVPHLELWASPGQVSGWQISCNQPTPSPTTAAAFLRHWIQIALKPRSSLDPKIP